MVLSRTDEAGSDVELVISPACQPLGVRRCTRVADAEPSTLALPAATHRRRHFARGHRRRRRRRRHRRDRSESGGQLRAPLRDRSSDRDDTHRLHRADAGNEASGTLQRYGSWRRRAVRLSLLRPSLNTASRRCSDEVGNARIWRRHPLPHRSRARTGLNSRSGSGRLGRCSLTTSSDRSGGRSHKTSPAQLARAPYSGTAPTDGRRTLCHMLPPIVNSDPGDETSAE